VPETKRTPRVEIVRGRTNGSPTPTSGCRRAYPGVRYVHQETAGKGRHATVDSRRAPASTWCSSTRTIVCTGTRYKLDYGSSADPRRSVPYGRCNLIDADGTWLAPRLSDRS